jgi:hypothetical protein
LCGLHASLEDLGRLWSDELLVALMELLRPGDLADGDVSPQLLAAVAQGVQALDDKIARTLAVLRGDGGRSAPSRDQLALVRDHLESARLALIPELDQSLTDVLAVTQSGMSASEGRGRLVRVQSVRDALGLFASSLESPRNLVDAQLETDPPLGHGRSARTAALHRFVLAAQSAVEAAHHFSDVWQTTCLAYGVDSSHSELMVDRSRLLSARVEEASSAMQILTLSAGAVPPTHARPLVGNAGALVADIDEEFRGWQRDTAHACAMVSLPEAAGLDQVTWCHRQVSEAGAELLRRVSEWAASYDEQSGAGALVDDAARRADALSTSAGELPERSRAAGTDGSMGVLLALLDNAIAELLHRSARIVSAPRRARDGTADLAVAEVLRDISTGDRELVRTQARVTRALMDRQGAASGQLGALADAVSQSFGERLRRLAVLVDEFWMGDGLADEARSAAAAAAEALSTIGNMRAALRSEMEPDANACATDERIEEHRRYFLELEAFLAGKHGEVERGAFLFLDARAHDELCAANIDALRDPDMNGDVPYFLRTCSPPILIVGPDHHDHLRAYCDQHFTGRMRVHQGGRHRAGRWLKNLMRGHVDHGLIEVFDAPHAWIDFIRDELTMDAPRTRKDVVFPRQVDELMADSPQGDTPALSPARRAFLADVDRFKRAPTGKLARTIAHRHLSRDDLGIPRVLRDSIRRRVPTRWPGRRPDPRMFDQAVALVETATPDHDLAAT